MAKVEVKQERCKGCYYCVESCPKKALNISEKKNGKGYTCVEWDENLCVACGTCFEVCPDFVYEIQQ